MTVHPATYVDRALKLVSENNAITIRNIEENFSSGTIPLPSLWLALPTDRYEDNHAFIYMPSPTLADIGEKIQSFYTMYINLSPGYTDNGPMGGLIYLEGADDASSTYTDLIDYESTDDMVVRSKNIVRISFGS